MDSKFRFTKKALEDLPIPEKRLRVRDTGVLGLVLDLLPSGTKTFRVYKKIKGSNKPVNVTLGKFPSISIENARKGATEAISRLSSGINPNDERRAAKKSKVSLKEAFDDYSSSRELSPSTLKGYHSVLNTYLVEYRDKPLINITEEIVKKEHARLTKSSPAQADHAMRFLRAIFNFAKYEYRGVDNGYLFEQNPVQILSHQRAWNKVGRKNTRITIGQLKAWFEGVSIARESGDDFSVAVCDLLEVALLTGLRRSELLSLQWSQVNLKEKTYFIDKTKNGDPLELPISNHVHDILLRRKKLKDEHDYVFNVPNDYGVIKEPKKVIAKIRELTGIEFTLHDLRRTFTTTGESLNIGPYMIKRLLNHRTRRDDVTAGYIILTPEELRVPAQNIENKILEQAGIANSSSQPSSMLLDLIIKMSDSEKSQLLEHLSIGAKI